MDDNDDDKVEEDKAEAFCEASPALTTSCFGSTLLGTLVRLIFILSPLSTDET